MKQTALGQSMLVDRRRLRAQSLVHHILQIVGKHLSDEDRRQNAVRELSYELMEKLWEKGIEIITDADRAAAGLPPRGPEGWTAEELMALEQRRLEMMTQPITIMMPVRS